MNPVIRAELNRGVVIPAHPLALTSSRQLDERRQRALARYYSDAGAGGLAVGVHTTQFAIRNPEIGLYEPVLAIAAEEMDRSDRQRAVPLIRIAGAIGATAAAVADASAARNLGYHAALLSLAGLADWTDAALLDHCAAVGKVLPLIGFYIQPAVGGRRLSFDFWRRFAEFPAVVAIKIAPFNRYQTLDVVRAVAEAGRDDIALYTGNDDNIVNDLITPYRLNVRGRVMERKIVGGLLGHWACWTRSAAALLKVCHSATTAAEETDANLTELLSRNIEVTDCNAAFFDVANGFKGCIAGIHEVLRRQGLLAGTWCLDPNEGLSGGQFEEISRIYAAYPHLNDDDFVSTRLEQWLSG